MLNISVEIASEIEKLPEAKAIKKFVDKREDEKELKNMARGQYKSVIEVRKDNELQLVRSIGRTGYYNNTCGLRKLLEKTIKIENNQSSDMMDYWILFGKYVAEK